MPEQPGERSLDELTVEELEELISELDKDDPMAQAIRRIIERRQAD